MRNEFWIISTLISIGLIGGFIYNWPRAQQSGANRQFPDSKVDALLEPARKLNPEDLEDYGKKVEKLLRQGDNYLQVGNFEDATEYYAILLNLHKQAFPDEPVDFKLYFRIALASELSGQHDTADYYYRFTLDQNGMSLPKRLLVELSQTRNMTKFARQTVAIEKLSELYLTHEGNEQIDDALRFEIGHQISQILYADTENALKEQMAAIDRPVLQDCPIDIGGSLQRIDLDESNVPPVESIPIVQTQLDVLQNPNGNLELIIVGGAYQSTAVSKMLSEVGQMTGLQFQMDANVQPYLIGRTIKFRFTAISMAVLLDVILHPLALTWEQTGDTIRLIPANLVTKEAFALLRSRQTIRLSRQLIVNYPNDRCRGVVRLASANTSLMAGQYDVASTSLSQLLEEQPANEIRAKVLLNLGLIEKKFQRYDSAIEYFLAAVDQSLDHRIQAIAYANIARVQMEQRFIDPAIIASSRSLSLTKDLSLQSFAALDMARGYLLSRDPQSANRILFDHQDAFTSGLNLKLARAFGAYARSLGTQDDFARDKAIGTLVIALADVDTGKLRHTVDRMIVADAYKSIGLPNQAINTLLITNAQPENAIWERIRTFELAQLLMQYGNQAAAVSNFQKLAGDLSDEVGQRSILELAEFRLGQRNADRSLDLCRMLWQTQLTDSEEEAGSGLTEIIKTQALRLMGKAFTAKGDFNSAAFCYSGRLPVSATSVRSEGQVQ